MKLSVFFVERPIFAAAISISIVIVGLISYSRLPVAQYPDVPPTVVVRASYPGADARTVADSVATPIEQEVNGVEGMLYMSSQSTDDGSMTLTVSFKVGTDLDTAQVLVQNRVAIATPRLPEDVRRLGVITEKSSPDLLLVVHLFSPDNTFDQLYISNYALLQVRDVLSRLDGVGSVQPFGLREYSMRVWLDPDRMAFLEITTGDVLAALQDQNVQVAAGALGQEPMRAGQLTQIAVRTKGRFRDPEEFGDVVVKSVGEERVVRLRDIARVELGAQSYVTNSYLDDAQAVALAIAQRPGTNALDAARDVRETMAELSEVFPDGLRYTVAYDPTVFVAESIKSVYHTIFEAAILVVAVILLFLHSLRATLIPVVAIPVSLIGTFFFMSILGFSLNMLSLFGLVLAIGIVVDDAIVVVENAERHLRKGISPREAARRAMKEVSGPIVAMSLVLVAVFVPTLFIEGISGRFYQQFALTIAMATMLSMVNSLTLSSSLCGLLLKQHSSSPERKGARRLLRGLSWPGRTFVKAFDWLFEKAEASYAALVRLILKLRYLALLGYLALLVATGWIFLRTPTGFIPEQDQGYVIVDVQTPQGSSLQRTDEVVRELIEVCNATEGVRATVAFVGFSGANRTNAPNAGALFAALEPFHDRGPSRSAQVILDELREQVSRILRADVAVFNPPPVRGLGTSGGFKMLVQDRGGRGPLALQEAAGRMLDAAMAHERIAFAFSTYRADTPQLYAQIDRTKVEMLDVSVGDVFEALQVHLGSSFVNDFNYLGRIYQVRAQADAEYRREAEDIGRLRVRSRSGAMVPLGSLITLEPVAGPPRVERFNLYPAADLNGVAALGVSSGQSLDVMEELASKNLPRGMGFAWTDIAFQEKAAGDLAAFVFLLAVVFVFLLLAAQYESWGLPLAVILIVPMCLLAGLGGVLLRGFDNNILTQIGLVVLVGLACKNAILIVEFARSLENDGKNPVEAAIEACRLRLRPILMTSSAFGLGVVPLLLATGPGAEIRQAIGTVVFFGMLGVTVFGLFLTPVFYVLIRGTKLRTSTEGQPHS